MSFFKAYLRQHRRTAFAVLVFIAVFAGSFALYHLPLMGVIYPAMLCAVVGAVLIAVDFLEKRRRHLELERLLDMTSAEITGLPPPATAAEEDLQALIRSLLAEARERESLAALRYRDTVEYYTVWAHQIKTPITAMRLTLGKEDSALARRLSAELTEIERYVEMVLAYLRLDSESSDYLFREQSLDVLVEEVIAGFAAQFIDKRLRLDYAPSGVTVITDEKWLSFVLGQILSNALKYTFEGGVRIFLEKPRTLVIEDTGIGIDPADLPRVFEKGYTGFNGRTDRRASGIGLYLVRRVCRNLGVGISIASAPGEGTRVSLDLDQYKLKAE